MIFGIQEVFFIGVKVNLPYITSIPTEPGPLHGRGGRPEVGGVPNEYDHALHESGGRPFAWGMLHRTVPSSP